MKKGVLLLSCLSIFIIVIGVFILTSCNKECECYNDNGELLDKRNSTMFKSCKEICDELNNP